MNAPNEAIAETWEIREADLAYRVRGFPFFLVRTGDTGHETIFLCGSIEEAQGKLNQVARVFDKQGHTLAVA